MKKSVVLFAFLCFGLAGAFSQTGSITNVQVAQRSDGSGLVDVYFDLNGSGSTYNISLEVSFNSGSNYTIIPSTFLSGDIGPISSGINKHIIWDGLSSFPNTYSDQSRLKITASENVGCPTTLTDIDGNTYQTVKIGDQCWMKENLKTTKYNNGSNIEYPGSNNTVWQNNTSGAYAWYNNDNSWKNIYGALYNWRAVNNASGLCPIGWHVPRDDEWTQLTTYISGGTNNCGTGLKSCRQVNSPLGGNCNTSDHPRWNSNDTYFGTDEYGFSAFPGGYRGNNGFSFYFSLGNAGYWWSATENSTTNAWSRSVSFSSPMIYNAYASMTRGYSVRCIKN